MKITTWTAGYIEGAFIGFIFGACAGMTFLVYLLK